MTMLFSRTIGAVLLLAAAGCLSNLHALLRVRSKPADVPVEVYAHRFDALRPLLPALGRLGYVSDSSRLGDTEVEGLFLYLTQYHLAPLVVEPGTGPELVIGDFHDRVPPPGAFGAEGLRAVHALENGVVLYRREGP